MKIGFTGSRGGMTADQHRMVALILEVQKSTIGEFHHGDCIGSDYQAHQLARALRGYYRIIVHPPANSYYRAFCEVLDGDEMRPVKPYTVRDRDIVDETDLLIATPRPSSRGTWTTVRMALETGKTHVVISEDGTPNWSDN